MPIDDQRRIVIAGAAGRDFHNFNVVYRDDPTVCVVAFTAAQIPGIAGRRYPASLAGPRYPEGIAIDDEAALEVICRRERVDEVVCAYSDVRHEQVMHVASRALACGADFTLLGPTATMLRADVLVIAVSATRTGVGKSQTARWLSRRLRDRGLRVAAIRHPMPYGDLERQRLQRFASMSDLDAAACSIEEREEYEPHIASGTVVYAGVDYAAILEQAEQEADVIVWDGGNNDFPFIRPDLHIVLTDALRPADADRSHPGEACVRMADVIVIAKTNAASAEQVAEAEREAHRLNPGAQVVRAASPVTLDATDSLRGHAVLVVDDGPTLTHGGMPYGAGYVAAVAAGATIVDPLPYADPTIVDALALYPHVRSVLPALGYGAGQLAALERSIAAVPVDTVISGTPIDLAALVRVPQRIVRARYEFAEAGPVTLGSIVDAAIQQGSPRGS